MDDRRLVSMKSVSGRLLDGYSPKYPAVHVLHGELIGGEIRMVLKGSDERVNDPVLMLPDLPEIQDEVDVLTGRARSGIPPFLGVPMLLGGIACVAAIIFVFVSNVWRFVPISMEEALGDSLRDTLLSQFTEAEEPEVLTFLEECIVRLENPDSPFTITITILDEPEANAFALPGGQIFFFRGLIEESESAEELAGILAHEMAHVERRHGMKNISRAVGTVFVISTMVGIVGGLEELEAAELLLEGASLLSILQYSRKMETDADKTAMEKLQRAEISASGLYEFFNRLQVENEEIESIIPDWMSTHPATGERLLKLKAHVENEPQLLPMMDAESWAALKEENQVGTTFD